jgi:hypothetical protein
MPVRDGNPDTSFSGAERSSVGLSDQPILSVFPDDAGSAARIAAAIADVYGGRLTPGWGEVGDVLSIRRHLWEEDVPHLGEVRHWSNDVLGGTVGAEGLPPPLEVGARFDVVIAADVLYFFEQVLRTTYTALSPPELYVSGSSAQMDLGVEAALRSILLTAYILRQTT